MKTYVHIGTCTRVFLLALFVIDKRWKQSEWPSTGKWINKMWGIHTTDYYSDIKRNEVLIYVINAIDP